MKKQIKKFLEFNGKNIYFLAVDGIYWIAVTPICNALKVDEQKQHDFLHDLQKNITLLYAERRMVGNENFAKVVSHQYMETNSGKLRKMLCVSEQYVYGWIFQIQSPNNPELLIYKIQCYQLLYNYFHGVITERENLLKVKTKAEIEIEELELQLQNSTEFKRIQELKKSQKIAGSELRKLDRNLVETQLDLWKQEFVKQKEQPETQEEVINQ